MGFLFYIFFLLFQYLLDEYGVDVPTKKKIETWALLIRSSRGIQCYLLLKQGQGNQCQTPEVKFQSPVLQSNFSFGDISVLVKFQLW